MPAVLFVTKKKKRQTDITFTETKKRKPSVLVCIVTLLAVIALYFGEICALLLHITYIKKANI